MKRGMRTSRGGSRWADETATLGNADGPRKAENAAPRWPSAPPLPYIRSRTPPISTLHGGTVIVRTTLRSLLLLALLALPVRALAQASLNTPVMKSGVVGLDAMSATVFQQGQSSFSGIALRLRIRHASLRPNVELLPTFEYWQSTNKVNEFQIETRRRDATMSGDVRWVFLQSAAHPYVGMGYGLHFLNSEVRAPRYGLPHETHGLVKGGLDAMIGIQSGPEARFGSFLELKYLDVSLYRQVKISTGVAWNFQ
jgi:hypothetical protein